MFFLAEFPVQYEKQTRTAGFVYGLREQWILPSLPHGPPPAAKISF